MPALNFQEQFVADVESGKKCQTIRAPRKRPFKVGDTLYLYTGMRTKGCRKLREVRCSRMAHISIYSNCYEATGIDAAESLDEFAARDGFSSWVKMRDWFRQRYGLPFEGVLIEWAAP